MFNDEAMVANSELSASNKSFEVPPNDKDSQSSTSGMERKSITLDEFLIMNKDVFGEGLDFQGVEEIPRQVVTNQLRRKAKPKKLVATTKIPCPKSVQLEKLKKAGVVVKVNTNNKNKMQQKDKVVNKIPQNTPLKIADHIKGQLLNKFAVGDKNTKPQPQSKASKQIQPSNKLPPQGNNSSLSRNIPPLKSSSANTIYKPPQKILSKPVNKQSELSSGSLEVSKPPFNLNKQTPICHKISTMINKQPLSSINKSPVPVNIVSQSPSVSNKSQSQPMVTSSGLQIPMTGNEMRATFTPNQKTTSNLASNRIRSKSNIQGIRSPIRPTVTKSNKQKIEPPVEPPGHFSCFKKPKESLIPVSEVPEVLKSITEANFAKSLTMDMKMSTSIQSPICSDREIKREPVKMQDKKRNVPLEMVEKLKRQGLLSIVKKPKIDGEQSDSSSQGNVLTVKTGG